MADTKIERVINGRTIVFNPPTDAQALLLGSIMRKLRANGNDDNRTLSSEEVERVSTILDIIDSMVDSEQDRAWLENGVVSGTVDLTQLTSALHSEKQQEQSKKRVTKKTTTSARKKS